MIRRKGIPDGGCSMCCRLKQKLDELWQRTSGCILRIRGISPDGQGDFALEAGTNINITEVSNGVRIDTTGGVSYYEPADAYVTIDNDTLEIGVVAGVQDGLATQNDLETVASAVTNIIDGTTEVAEAAHADTADSATSAGSATNATNAQYLGSSSSNVGSDVKPVKIVNGQAVEVANNLVKAEETVTTMALTGNLTGNFSYAVKNGMCTISIWGKSINAVSSYTVVASGIPKALVNVACPVAHDGNGTPLGLLYINTVDPTKLAFNSYTTTTDHVFISMTYPIDE